MDRQVFPSLRRRAWGMDNSETKALEMVFRSGRVLPETYILLVCLGT